MLTNLSAGTERSNMIISTGNTLENARPDLTLAERLEDSVKTWLFQHPGQSIKTLPSMVSLCETEQLQAVDISAKLFVPQNISGEVASHIFEQVLEECKNMNSVPIENFVLSLEGLAFSDPDDTVWSQDAVLDIWNRMVKTPGIEQLVGNFGIAECSAARLEHLISATTIKPKIDQINATECCALPPALLQLAKKNNIKLLAHHDIEEILPQSELAKLLDDPSAQWKWILRLTCIAQDRQVLLCNKNFVCI